MARRMLSREEVKAFYDRLGARQDLQLYERPAVEALLVHGRFEDARAVVELGCGTGALAERLLRERLPGGATYLGLDLSETMVRLASARLRAWAGRARVERTDGAPVIPVGDGGCDRLLATYVLDLLPDADIVAVLREARRVLAPGGLLCLASLTFGPSGWSRLVSTAWDRLQARWPALVGGCRPLRLLELVGDRWRVEDDRVLCRLGVCSETLVAS